MGLNIYLDSHDIHISYGTFDNLKLEIARCAGIDLITHGARGDKAIWSVSSDEQDDLAIFLREHHRLTPEECLKVGNRLVQIRDKVESFIMNNVEKDAKLLVDKLISIMKCAVCKGEDLQFC